MPEPLLFIPQSWPFPDAAEDSFIAPEFARLAAACGPIVVAPLQGAAAGTDLPTPLRPWAGTARLDAGLLGSLGSRRPVLGGLLHLGRARPGLDAGGWAPGAVLARAAALARAAGIRSRLRRLVARHRPRLVYTYWFDAATIAACQLGLPTATRAHGYDLYEDRHPRGFQPLRRWALDRLRLVACVSEHGRRHLAERHPGRGRYEVHRLGCPDPGVSSAWSGDRIGLVSCSAAIPLKRLPRIAAIVAALARATPLPVRWCHLGDGPELPAVRRILAGLPPGRVSWELAGAVPHALVPERLCRERPLLFINQSSSEGVPLGAMEAFSCGIPVCAAAVGGLPELVDDANGLLHGADEPAEAVAARIVALAADPGRAARLAQGARSTWERQCDPERNHRAFAGRLLELAGC